jgi:hypothetical protein
MQLLRSIALGKCVKLAKWRIFFQSGHTAGLMPKDPTSTLNKTFTHGKQVEE